MKKDVKNMKKEGFAILQVKGNDKFKEYIYSDDEGYYCGIYHETTLKQLKKTLKNHYVYTNIDLSYDRYTLPYFGINDLKESGKRIFFFLKNIIVAPKEIIAEMKKETKDVKKISKNVLNLIVVSFMWFFIYKIFMGVVFLDEASTFYLIFAACILPLLFAFHLFFRWMSMFYRF